MDKKFIVILAPSLVILLAGMLLAVKYATNSSKTPPQAENSLAFYIPDSALPSEISKEQISAKPISTADFSSDELELGASFVFRMEPDGTQFNEPVSFSLTISVPDYAKPILFNV